ncbi:MAG: hypothetical protein H6825_12420 [Planctomycetes bacterium]|nr:hypothetical protein [Planctomycetota bacterium]
MVDGVRALPEPRDPRLARERAKVYAADFAAQGSEAAPTPRLRAMLQFAERLARVPESMDEEALDPLRAHGLDDRAIHDLAQVVGFFSSINRLAEALGVDPEPDW